MKKRLSALTVATLIAAIVLGYSAAGFAEDLVPVPPGLAVVEMEGTAVVEGGLADSFTVALVGDIAPNADVTVTLTAATAGELTLNGSADTAVLIFTPENYLVAQEVSVEAVDDAVAELGEEVAVSIVTACPPVDESTPSLFEGLTAGVVVTVSDNDKGVFVSETGNTTCVTERGNGDAFGLALSQAPDADVTVTLTCDEQVVVTPAALTFTIDDWNVEQSVAVTAVDDLLFEGPHSGEISFAVAGGGYDGIVLEALLVHVVDNEKLLPPRALKGWPTGEGVYLEWRTPAKYNVPSGVSVDYEIYIADRGSGPWYKVKDVKGGPDLRYSCTITQADCDLMDPVYNLVPGQRYAFRAKAYMEIGDIRGASMQWSNVANVIAGPLPPASARALKVASAADGVNLTWQAPPLPKTNGMRPGPAAVDGYDIYAASSSRAEKLFLGTVDGSILDFAVTSTMLSDAGLEYLPGGRYYFFVYSWAEHPLIPGLAVNSARPATASGAAGPIPPLPPTGLRAKTAAGGDGVDLVWKAPSTKKMPAPTGYVVSISATTDLASFVEVKRVAELATTVTAAEALAAGFTMTGGTTYYFMVKSYNDTVIGEVLSLRGSVSYAAAAPLP